MNLLITGGTGFVGGRLLHIAKERFKRDGVRIIALTSRQISGYTCILHENYTFQKESFYEAGIKHIDAVIHLGGYSPKNRNEMGAWDQYLASIQNTQYLLEHLPTIPSQFIFCSTISVYDESTYDVITEKTVPQPATLYGMYKLYCEKLILTWGAAKNVVVHNLRLGNAYGPGEEKYRCMVPLMIRQAMEGKDLSLYVKPDIRRNYIYIDDACNMMLNALKLKEDVGPINLVSGKNATMEELVDTIASGTRQPVGWSIAETLSEAKDILFSNEKAKKYLGEESFNLKTGIAEEFKYFENLEPLKDEK